MNWTMTCPSFHWAFTLRRLGEASAEPRNPECRRKRVLKWMKTVTSFIHFCQFTDSGCSQQSRLEKVIPNFTGTMSTTFGHKTVKTANPQAVAKWDVGPLISTFHWVQAGDTAASLSRLLVPVHEKPCLSEKKMMKLSAQLVNSDLGVLQNFIVTKEQNQSASSC